MGKSGKFLANNTHISTESLHLGIGSSSKTQNTDRV